MIREKIEPRPDWQAKLEECGGFYHTPEGEPYWCEDACYVLSEAEVLAIEKATNELHAMCMEHVEDTIDSGDYTGYEFPDAVKQAIQRSWERDEYSLYGRFDLGYNGTDLKLFEYNADTPTSLPEASIWQWQVLQDRGWPDQFNSLHEKLIDQWPVVAMQSVGGQSNRLYFATMKEASAEDWGNLNYLLQTAAEAGFDTTSIDIEQIGWNGTTFTDLAERPIRTLFKLYPWEWLMADEFGWNVNKAPTYFCEPAWKMLLSTKALLPLLWDAHENHPLLLEAHKEEAIYKTKPAGEWIRKPTLGREGANITKVEVGAPIPAPAVLEPKYDKHGYVAQRRFIVPSYDGFYPVLGCWVVGDEAAGLGIREDATQITTNMSRFVPHYFE